MRQELLWRWVYRDPVSGRLRTDGRMTEGKAARYPGAMRLLGFGLGRPAPDPRTDFEDTQAGTFRTTGAHAAD